MIHRFLRLFAQVRDLDNLIAAQSESLESEVRAHEITKTALEVANIALESERARRISSDTVAGERREEIDRLIVQNHELLEQSHTIMADRLKSLDSLNLRLMDTRTVEKTPDLAQHNALVKLTANVITGIREKERAMDRALLTRFNPGALGLPRVTMNEPQPEATEAA